MYIAGEWTDSENGDVSQAINPATGDSIATVPKATVNDVNRSVRSIKSRLYKILSGRIWTLLKEDEY